MVSPVPIVSLLVLASSALARTSPAFGYDKGESGLPEGDSPIKAKISREARQADYNGAYYGQLNPAAHEEASPLHDTKLSRETRHIGFDPYPYSHVDPHLNTHIYDPHVGPSPMTMLLPTLITHGIGYLLRLLFLPVRLLTRAVLMITGLSAPPFY